MDISIIYKLLSVVGVLTLVVNVITEVVKKLLKKANDDFPIPIIVVSISIILSVLTLIAYGLYNSTTIYWYYIVGAVVMGFFVSYAAIFGYDTLKEKIIEKIGNKEE